MHQLLKGWGTLQPLTAGLDHRGLSARHGQHEGRAGVSGILLGFLSDQALLEEIWPRLPADLPCQVGQ